MSGKILFPDDKEAKRLIIEVGKRMYDKDYCCQRRQYQLPYVGWRTLGDAFRRFQGIYDGRYSRKDGSAGQYPGKSG